MGWMTGRFALGSCSAKTKVKLALVKVRERKRKAQTHLDADRPLHEIGLECQRWQHVHALSLGLTRRDVAERRQQVSRYETGELAVAAIEAVRYGTGGINLHGRSRSHCCVSGAPGWRGAVVGRGRGELICEEWLRGEVRSWILIMGIISVIVQRVGIGTIAL